MNDLGEITVSPRVAIHQEIEATRQAFHALVASLEPTDWYLPVATPGWTIGDSLNQLVLSLRVISWQLLFSRLGIWHPRPLPDLLDNLNPSFIHLLSRRQNIDMIATQYDRAYTILVNILESIRDDQLVESTFFPDPTLVNHTGFVSYNDFFHSVSQHYKIHREKIRQALAVINSATTSKSSEKESFFPQTETGWFSYPTSFWQRLFFKAPIELWRLGLGWLVGGVLMLITHTGRKSGLPRRTMVEYHCLQGIKYAPCAFGPRSDWYQNIMANPYVVIQTIHGAEHMKAMRVVDKHELLRVFALFMRRDPPLMKTYLASLGIMVDPADVLAKKDRIYWLRFDPTDKPTPPPLKADLSWIWVIALAGGLLSWLYSRYRTHRK